MKSNRFTLAFIIVATILLLIAVVISDDASAEPSSSPTFSQITATSYEKNCTRDGDPWTAAAVKVRLRGSDEWVRIAPLTDGIRKQVIQQRAQSMLEAKWCRR